jgi:hypothetical protein
MNPKHSPEIVFKNSSVDFLADYVDFYRTCFPRASHLCLNYLEWLYQANPAGTMLGADAYSENMIVGQVVAIPGEYYFFGRQVKGLLAVNVAVHPKYQGRYLFKKLGLKMCEYGAEAGHEFVIGVANAAATPGWTRQMGFQLVRPLEARLGVGNPGIDFNRVRDCEQFGKRWSDVSLSWRLANPNNPVFVRRAGTNLQCFAAAKGLLLPEYAELPDAHPALPTGKPPLLSPVRLFLGLVPGGACRFSTYIDIPQRYRPSPLNFIYRSLTDHEARLDRDGISFSFLDFDAY